MTGDFVGALLGAQLPLVMEVKYRDADGGDLRRGRTLDDIVTGYLDAGATCLSVVTGRWYGGTPELLPACAELTDRPLLLKDFLRTRKHLREARERGASAVLLTAALLSAETLRARIEDSLDLGLTPFVEVTSEKEIATLPPCPEVVVAVNNKDIRQRERGAAELARSLALLDALRSTGTPCPVSASGIDAPDTAAALLQAGFGGLLVGSALMRCADAAEWSRQVEAARARLSPGSLTRPGTAERTVTP